MIRLQDNTPSIYTEQSRDFQLFLRLYDCIINGVKFDIDSVSNLNNPALANDRILNLLCTRVGFFPKRDYDSTLLRYILESFSYLIKNKGNKVGIEGAICTVLEAEGDFSTPTVVIDNTNYVVNIYTSSRIYNKKALNEVLRYILPIGYELNIEESTPISYTTEIGTADFKITSLCIPTISNSQIRGADRVFNNSGQNPFNFNSELQDAYVANITTSSIVGEAEAQKDLNTYSPDRNGTNRDDIDKSQNMNQQPTPTKATSKKLRRKKA